MIELGEVTSEIEILPFHALFFCPRIFSHFVQLKLKKKKKLLIMSKTAFSLFASRKRNHNKCSFFEDSEFVSSVMHDRI